MPSLWYFQNCLEASFPATRVRTADAKSECSRGKGADIPEERWARQLTFLAAGMLMLKFRQVIDIFVDHDPVMDVNLGASTVSGFLHTRDHPSSCG